MCTCARPYGRAGQCGFGGRGVTFDGQILVVRTVNRHLTYQIQDLQIKHGT
jgi:hypothetical protein